MCKVVVACSFSIFGGMSGGFLPLRTGLRLETAPKPNFGASKAYLLYHPTPFPTGISYLYSLSPIILFQVVPRFQGCMIYYCRCTVDSCTSLPNGRAKPLVHEPLHVVLCGTYYLQLQTTVWRAQNSFTHSVSPLFFHGRRVSFTVQSKLHLEHVVQ